MVNLEDNYLLFFIAAIFIPLFGFLMKMLMETANTKTRLDKFDEHIKDSKEKLDFISVIDGDLKVIKSNLIRIEKDIVELFRRGRRDAVSRGSSQYDERKEESDRRDEYDDDKK